MTMKARIFSAIALSLFVLASCQAEYDYEKKQKIDAPASLGLTIDGLDEEVALMAPKTKSFALWINAKSISDEALTVTIGPNPGKVSAYNAEHGTSYEAVPGDAFTISATQFLLPRYNTVSTQEKITLNSTAMPEDGETYILPISITKVEGSENISMSEADSTVYIFFRRKLLPASGYEFGSGTESDPYIIRNETEMLCMTKGLKSGQKTYFKLDCDVDMSELEDWAPLNNIDPYDLAVDFDGAGHKLIGFNCSSESSPSMFGVLNGSVHDVTFERPVLTVGASKAGLLGAAIGSENFSASVTNVKVNGLVINLNGTTAGVGGLAGGASNATFKDIDIDVTVVDANKDDKMPDDVSGVVGIITKKPCTFTNVNVKGSLYGTKRTAGIVSYINSTNGCQFINCHTDIPILSNGENCGGILGYANGQELLLENCSAKGDIQVGGNYCGGIIGSMAGGATIRKCFSEVNLTARTGNHIGGLIGNGSRLAGAAPSLIEDCYATGDVILTASGNRMAGGLIGVMENNCIGTTIRRCYASGDVKAVYMQVGGLLAIAKDGKPAETDLNFTIEQCIAWNKVVSNDLGTGNNWSSGAVIGVANIKNTMTDCYRRPDMTYKDGNRDYVLKDMENTSPSAPLAYDASLNFYAYHGKAAPEGSTISSVAKMLKWPETIWDLSGDSPKLK